MTAPATDPGTDDDARDRIRDAALALIGRHGYAGASVRAIAEAAGVSPALVLHHFGSKEGLRAACDAHILDALLGDDALAPGADVIGLARRWLAELPRTRPSFDYLARMIIDGGPAGDRLFDAIVDRTAAMLAEGERSGAVRPSSDPRTTAVVVAAHGLVPLLLQRHIERALGEDGLSASAVERLTLPTLELYTHGLYADGSMLDGARAALAPEGAA